MSITPATVLEVAPDVSVRIRSRAEVEVDVRGMRIVAGAHTLAILDFFRVPAPLGVALDRLGSRASGVQDWIELSATVHEFARRGILRDPTLQHATLAPAAHRFDGAYVHISMLNDRTRTERYLAAIREGVRHGDVVVDLGTGSGVLAVAAAQAGARHVYAIEESRIGEIAREVFARNGVADRVTLVEGHSTQVELPERGDVLVSEIIGLDPLGEGVLEFTRDATQRLLRPGARLIPDELEIHVTPVTLPDGVVHAHRVGSAHVESWREWYGIDFSPLHDASSRSLYAFAAAPVYVRRWEALGEPACIYHARLGSIGTLEVDARCRLPITVGGRLDAVVLSCAARLAPGIRLSTDARDFREDNHWHHRVWGFPDALEVRAGDVVEIALRHRVDGDPVGVRIVEEAKG